MDVMLIDAAWDEEVVLPKKMLDHLRKKQIDSLALFASVQFLKLDKVVRQLEELDIEVLPVKAKHTEKMYQMLGCDIYEDCYDRKLMKDVEEVIYIGDGMFHPKALLLAGMKDIIIFDPISDTVKFVSQNEIKKQAERYKANFARFMSAQTIGILVTTKPGQQYLKWAQELQEKLEKEGKKAYIFIDDTLPLDQLENFPFIEAWVNAACPRIGTDDIVNFKQAIINIRDAFNPEQYF